MRRSALLFSVFFICQLSLGQRNYVPNSVLRSGDWYKISIKQEGIYSIDYRFLKSMGVNVSQLHSSAIRVFGNGGAMLPEKVSTPVLDDLQENAIEVRDGGDGQFQDGDYILFYAAGPHRWVKDSLQQRFTHQQNIYSDQSYYFINIGENGKRIHSATAPSSVAMQVSAYDARYYYEPDLVNFLSSGKEWYGDGFTNNSSGINKRSFTIPFDNLVTSERAIIVSDCAARSIGASSVFTIKGNQLEIARQEIAGVTASSYDLFAETSERSATFSPAVPLQVQYEFTSGGVGAEGWLNWFEVFARRKLIMTPSTPLFFRDWKSVSAGNTAEYVLSNVPAGTEIWDVTDPLQPQTIQATQQGDQFRFTIDCSNLKEFVAFKDGLLTPVPIGKIKNQDLHATAPQDMLIITHPLFISEATRLSAFHQAHDGLKTLIVTTDQVFNEFASGSPDPAAIRNFVKMYLDKAGGATTNRPQYLLLFGDASYDYKNKQKGNSNLLPAFETANALDPLASYTSDDFYGFLDDTDDINDPDAPNLLDIGIGRIPSRTLAQARDYVTKVIGYKNASTLGSWRNEFTFIADDEDFNLHLQDAETVTNAARAVNDVFLLHKIYLDAFKQESNAAGSRFPAVNQAVKERVEKGSLILNYNGHGGFRRLAEEVVLDKDILESWYNPDRLPLFITATCDFAPYDNPSVYSLGEEMLLRQKTGAIALMTTTRLVFAFSNRVINQQYLQTALERKADGSYKSLGEAVMEAKNKVYASFSDVINNRKFTLLGDPALVLNFPRYQVLTTEINGHRPGSTPDTIKAFEDVAVAGVIADATGQRLVDFNGEVNIVVFDKPEFVSTLANDPSSLRQAFEVQEREIFRGRATVTSGTFKFHFPVPKDINYKTGNGRISYYAGNGVTDANGSFEDLVISGSSNLSSDISGPVIQAWIDDYQFKNGQVVSETPTLLVKLSDISGINTIRAAGHEMVAVLDGDKQNPFVLNDGYQPEIDQPQVGTISFRLRKLTEGRHRLQVKAWDNANNSAETLLEFVVKAEKQLIQEVMNYPNPMNELTHFCITHRRPAEKLEITISILTPHGQVIKSIKKTINTPLDRSCDIEWDGLDELGRRVKPGVYIYNAEIRTTDGATSNKSKKLIVM